jgi:hypothetical protein
LDEECVACYMVLSRETLRVLMCYARFVDKRRGIQFKDDWMMILASTKRKRSNLYRVMPNTTEILSIL